MLGTTIAALASGYGESALAIIRISGEDSFNLINKVFTNKFKENEAWKMKYGFLKDPKTSDVIDEVMCVYYAAPKSYTGEDMVEIFLHGGIVIIEKAMALLLANGARLARNGEFTERAYLNGRIDLIQAEAVNDMIRASSEEALQVALSSLKGQVSHVVKDFKEEIIDLLSHIEVNIDYPEYDAQEELTLEEITPRINNLIKEIEKIINDAKIGNIIKDGIKTAIVGKPNVGKSSLLNALIKEDKAIVTQIPGTTRDIVEGKINIDGIILNLLDTAGIRMSDDVVEKIGIEKSIKTIKEAQLVILVLDASRPLDEEDNYLLDITKNTNRIIVYNKIDQVNDLSTFEDKVVISAKNNQLDNLINKIKEQIGFNPSVYKYRPILSNQRHLMLMNKAYDYLKEAHEGALNALPVDLISVDIKNALEAVLELLGEEVNIDISHEIFARFCVGK
ncbi:TPA: tRNA uridine-5-carboxymethylaminomethyl(34) synthesis GTPase MnmE [bacterium]|nr:tRNA uridine-5-carboxymethylaminomethyl(34) synthesis GTPase MnmE [bacterium]